MSHRLSYRLPPDATAEAWTRALAGRFHLGKGRRVRRRRLHFDTFDGRLFSGGRLLWEEHSGRRVEVVAGRGDGRGGERRSPGTMPAFATTLAVPLQDLVLRRSAGRRLLPTLELEEEGWSRPLLDERRKTIARLELVELSATLAGAPGGPLPSHRLRLCGLRGFAEGRAAVAEWLVQAHSLLAETPAAEYADHLSGLGASPERASPRAAPTIERDQPADVAAKQALSQLWSLLRALEDGVRRRLDVEFLHDFRVVLRRMRSILRELAAVLPREELDRLRGHLEWLGRVTGPKRDLDVLRAVWSSYVEGLPQWVLTGLATLEQRIRRREAQEQEELAAALSSERYALFVKDWQRALTRRQRRGPASSARGIGDEVSARLAKITGKVLRRAERLSDSDSAQALHRLRIAAKRLRYVLEVFRPLFAPGELSRVLKGLKGTQDALGEFNDIVTHQRMIQALAGEAAEQGPSSIELALATGYLLATLDRRLADARERVDEELRDLLRPSRRARLHRLAASEEEDPK